VVLFGGSVFFGVALNSAEMCKSKQIIKIFTGRQNTADDFQEGNDAIIKLKTWKLCQT
jgi:hypothetical protein